MERSFEPAWNHLAALVLSALAASACEAPRETGPTEGPQAAVPRPVHDAPPSSREVSTHSLDQLHVQWPERSQLQADVLARMTDAARAAVQLSPLPVLVPRKAGLTERTQLAVKPAFYAASIRGEGEHAGVVLNVSATRIAHRYPGMPRAEKTDRVRGDRPAWVLANEGIWSVTWDEHGVSYVVELECARPYEDTRCANSDYVVAIADDLAFVGGTFDGGLARPSADGGAR